MTYEEWLAEVNRETVALVGMRTDDFEDWKYRDAYDDGMDPDQAAREALEYAGWEG